jgi:dephospho-CoA kinase
MIVIGLTGSIGMGKSTVAAMFAELGAAVQDADAVVADLYAPGGEAVAPVLKMFPEARGEDGGVDRAHLSRLIAGKPQRLKDLETLVHPLVQQRRDAFIAAEQARGTTLAVLDVPLLFEVGLDRLVDQTVVVSAPADVQRARVLARPGMTNQKLEQILARQISDAEKRRRADFVIDNGGDLESTRRQVKRILAKLAGDGEPQH